MMTLFKAAGLSTVLAAAVALAPAAHAQTLIVDVDQIYKDSTAAKSGQQQIEAKYGNQLRGLQSSLEAAVKDWNTQIEAAQKLAKPNTPLPPATQQSLEKARDTLQAAQNRFEDARREVNTVGQYVQLQILDKLIPISEQIRKDRKAQVVMPRGSVLAFDPAQDITATALQQLNATVTTVSITLPQQQQGQGTAPAATTPATPAPKQPQSR